jgi:viroplasmin and RNaseH domain-containing protein
MMHTRDSYENNCLKVKRWKKVLQANWLQKQEEVSILISEKGDFKLKSMKRDNEGHFIFMKGTIHQDKISILNIYATNTEATTYI